MFGKKQKVEIKDTRKICSFCEGSGLSGEKSCPECKGSGRKGQLKIKNLK